MAFTPIDVTAPSQKTKKDVTFKVTLETDSDGHPVYVARNGSEELRFSPTHTPAEIAVAVQNNNKRNQTDG